MGRPRKPRPQAEESADSSEQPPLVVPGSDDLMDIDNLFADSDEPSFNFLDFLTSTYPTSSDMMLQDFSLAQVKPPPSTTAAATAGAWMMGGMGQHLTDKINFDTTRPEASPPLAQEISMEEVAQFITPDIPDLAPGLSPNSASTPESAKIQTPPDGSQLPLCSCLPTLYLALDSMQRPPAEVGSAIRVARSAAKAAHNAILCPVCSSPPLEDVERGPSIRSFQTLMLVGAVLPSTANQYSRILTMVDDEAALATAERRRLRFSLADYGGFWGNMAASENNCGAAAHLEGSLMEPATWRLTARALLKIDVYGIQASVPGEEFEQVGLRDVVQMMEERAVERHRRIDDLIANGRRAEGHRCGVRTMPGETPTCLRIVEIAKRSLDHLVIP